MYWFLFCKDELLLKGSDTEGWHVPKGDVPPVALEPWQTQQVLPEIDGEPCVGVRLDAPADVGGHRMTGLRVSFDLLPRAEYLMAGKARELIFWDENTKFCGVCGGPLKRDTEISKRCTHCGKEWWPSLAPAVIVAVSRGEELLMVQSRNFRSDYMGLVAGFIETGETLEEAVAREVLEETHLKIRNIRYFGSQPWPYPNGLMIGFTADYESGELHIQRSELNKGGWFRADAMPAIPGPVSLARHLIDDWLSRQEKSSFNPEK